MSIKDLVVGGVTTLVIGGSAFTFSQADIVNNFAADTGMSQEQAEQYVSNVSEDELVSFDVLGEAYITDGESTLEVAQDIDCDNYIYDWESPTLTCAQGRSQLTQYGNTAISVGESYLALASESAAEPEILTTIRLLDEMNIVYTFEVIRSILGESGATEESQTASYNKATLQAAIDSTN